MALHIQDKEADRMVREFARRRGVGITDAVKLAVTEAAKADERRVEALRLRIQPLIDQVRAASSRSRRRLTGQAPRFLLDRTVKVNR